MNIARVIGNHQVIGIDPIRLFCRAFENIGLGDAFEFDGWLILLVDGLELHFGCMGQQGAGDQARAIAKRMKSQQLMWGTMPYFNQTAQFFLGQDHRASNLAEAEQNAPGKL